MSFVRLAGAFALATFVTLNLSAAIAGPAATPLVSTEWLSQNLGAAGLRVIDIRSGEGAPAAFEAAHIPGSIRADYPGAWRNRDWSLPEVSALEAYLSSLGVGADTTVVVVPAGTGSSELGGATWIYWVLKYLGHDQVAILDGGWNAWQADAAAPKEAGPAAAPAAATFTASLRPDLLILTDGVARELNSDTVIVDARPQDQYEGTTKSSLVARAGHIPGAISLDNARFYDAAANRLKPLAALEQELPPQLGDRNTRVISYCNTGHWSSIDWFVLHELLGFKNTTLYAGSMAAWAAREDLPVETGAGAGGAH